MKIAYSPDADVLTIQLRKGEPADSRDVAEGVIAHLSAKGQLLEVEERHYGSNRTLRMGKRSQEGPGWLRVTAPDLHPHLRARMRQRGVTRQEIEHTLNEGWEATDARSGTLGKVMVFPYQAEWEGQFNDEKEGTVYHRAAIGDDLALLTVKARYGKDFSRGARK